MWLLLIGVSVALSSADRTVNVGDGLLSPLFEVSPDLQQALAHRDHAKALAALKGIPDNTLRGHTLADKKFLEAWSLVHSGQGAKAAPLVDVVMQADHVPMDYRALVVGESLLAAGDPVAAAPHLEAVDETTPIAVRAQLALANARQDAGATAEAKEIWGKLIEQVDPAPGNPMALWALAQKAGTTSPAARPHLMRLWQHYPRTSQGSQAKQALETMAKRDPGLIPTVAETVVRADTLMGLGATKTAAALLEGVAFEPTPAGCRGAYVRGRSLFKRNHLTASIPILTEAGQQCMGIDDDRGAKALYLAGKAHERKKEWVYAAQAFEQIPQLYPEHTMADDGYALAGVATQIAGDDPAARVLWEKQVQDHPDGDLAAEGFWRLAWTAYNEGDPDGALAWVAQMLVSVPIETDVFHVQGAQYWQARWKIYPDVNAPTAQNPDASVVEQGLDELSTLVETHPGSFYAILAASRLYELAPHRIPERTPVAADDRWTVRADFFYHPNTMRGFALARLGLAAEARDELASLEDLTPSEQALRTQVHLMVDPVVAHDALHHYLLAHPPTTLGPDQWDILTLGHPLNYWDTLQAVAPDAPFDLQIFHGLVREESSFNKRIVSYAGARGLSQLMPATAREVAQKLGMSVSNADLFDPEINLTIGARFFGDLHTHYDGNAVLAVAAYNAGMGNVGKWLKANGDRPLDEFVELIPIRQTRHYVKRVLGTYQMGRVLYGDGPLVADWSAWNHEP